MKEWHKEFDEVVNKEIPVEDVFEIKSEFEARLKIIPNSTTYEVGYTTFGKPFYIQLDELDFSESVATSFTLEQAIELRDFLDSKIEILNKLKEVGE